MVQANILELARQGDSKAITSLMNSQLQLKNVNAKVSIKNGYLRVRLESAQFPDQQNLVKYVRQEIIGLRSESIKKIKVDGFVKGKNFPCWSQELNLELQPSYTSSSLGKQLSTSVLEEVKHQENHTATPKSIIPQKFSYFLKKLTDKKFILVILLLISMYVVGETYTIQQQGCIVQSYLKTKNTTNCQ